MNKHNPFTFKELSLDDEFCDRENDFDLLVQRAKSLANVVLYSPRRFGKTSLVKRVQNFLAKENAVAIYCHFFGITSVEDVAARLAKAVFVETKNKKPLFERAVATIRSFRPVLVLEPDHEKGILMKVEFASSKLHGYALLEDVMNSLGKFIKESKTLVHIALDEFQEITDLPEAIKIEGILREYIQRHKAAYLFVGSRRRVLLGMFNEKQRPFFRSAILQQLPSLPKKELELFLIERFSDGGKKCALESAETLVNRIDGFPYYAQKLSFFIFETAKKTITLTDIEKGFQELLQEETPVFENLLMSLTPQQISLLRALANEESGSIYSQDFMQRHKLNSIGGVQASLKKLSNLDLIEYTENKIWKIVDPIFAHWVSQKLT